MKKVIVHLSRLAIFTSVIFTILQVASYIKPELINIYWAAVLALALTYLAAVFEG